MEDERFYLFINMMEIASEKMPKAKVNPDGYGILT